MLTFDSATPGTLLYRLAQRMRERRLARGWSRAELSARSGVALATLQKFEQTGQVSLERLLRLADALDVLRDFERVLAEPAPPQSLAELGAKRIARQRQRGRTLHEPGRAHGAGSASTGYPSDVTRTRRRRHGE
jgi:transcriptional regulator with XRE-family HTH domain